MFNLVRELSSKIDNNAKTLSQISDNVNTIKSSVHENGKSLLNSLSSNLDNNSKTLNQINKIFNSLHSSTQRKSPISYSDVVGVSVSKKSSSAFTLFNTTSDSTDTNTKLAITKRKLIHGTATSINHGLGKAIPSKLKNDQAKGERIRVNKHIYVSRIEPSVKIEDITQYVNEQVSEDEKKHFSIRLLVKKDQQMSFISFRLSCTEPLFDKLMPPISWPSHVMIGEFVDIPRPSRLNLEQFIDENMDITNSTSMESSQNPFSNSKKGTALQKTRH